MINIGDVVTIQSRKYTRSNGKVGKVVGIEGRHYRVELPPNLSYLFLAHDLVLPDGSQATPPKTNDHTADRRQRNRNAQLGAFAKARGFDGLSGMLTALLDGKADVVKK